MNADAYEKCGSCGHYAAYCAPGAASCTAWDPEQSDFKCACKGRTVPKPQPTPAPAPEAMW